MIYFLEIQPLEEEKKELIDLLQEGVIKRAWNGELIYALDEDDIEFVKNELSEYEDFYEILNPLDYAEERYCMCDYSMSVSNIDPYITITIDEVVEDIREFDYMYDEFTEERMERVFKSENIEDSFEKLLDEICRSHFKTKLKNALDEVDGLTLW